MIKNKFFLAGALLLTLSLTACSSNLNQEETVPPLVVGGIPDQDPDKLQRQYQQLAEYLSSKLDVPVEYKPVTDYTAAVTAFKVGDLKLVWFGGLTGVQARLQVPGAEAIAQRDVDEEFHSLFIASTKAGLEEIKDISELPKLKGKTFTFGSESSTSGRLMPQYFLKQAGVKLEDFKGEVGFSGDHDKTIKLVESGAYQVGAVNEKVWEARVQSKEVDTSKVQVIWRTPAYYDYHWVIHPETTEQYGEDFQEKVQAVFLDLDSQVPEEKAILELFSAGKFIATDNDNYKEIEEVGREIGKIR